MKYCASPFRRLYMRPSGTVRVCPWSTLPIGNLLYDDLETIWNSEAAEQMRESIRDGSFRFCGRGCPSFESDSLTRLPDDMDDESLKQYFTAQTQPKDIECAFDYICNHSCPSCRSEVFVPDEQYKKNIEEISRKIEPYLADAEWIDADGQGEFLASPTMLKLLEKLEPQNPKFTISLQTNGVLFDEARWEKIAHLSKYPISLTVTPNSFERATYKYLSGGHDDLDKLLHNLAFISSLRQAGKIANFRVSIVVQDRNFRELPAFARRCIDEFKADDVIVRSIFRWFKMTEEEYLSKDILNPAHPYFEEYMDVLKDPRLNDPKIFWWGAKNVHPKALLAGEKMTKLHEVAMQWMELETKHPNALADYLTDKGYKKIGIYGYDRMGKLLLKKLKDWETVVIDEMHKQADPEVRTIHTTVDKYPETDMMIVSRFFEFDRIVDDIRSKTDAEIIPLDQFIEEICRQFGEENACCK